MARLQDPGSQAIRSQLDIEPECPVVFRPYTLSEALGIARIIREDEELSPDVRRLLEVGVVLDLMPGHLRPRRDRHARAIGCAVRTLLNRELRWEAVDPLVRDEIIRRAVRIGMARRAAAR